MHLNLTEKPDVIDLESGPLVYLEAIGPFAQTAHKSWQNFWALAHVLDKTQITAMVGLSRVDPGKTDGSGNIYQAGVTLKAKPEKIPPGLAWRTMAGGRYARFLLTSSYRQLPEAYPRIFSLLPKLPLTVRDDFSIEKYLNTPQDAKESELLTEILIPIA